MYNIDSKQASILLRERNLCQYGNSLYLLQNMNFVGNHGRSSLLVKTYKSSLLHKKIGI